MFQAEPVLWLQGFASPALTWLLRGVTLLGYAPVYIGLILLLAFAVRFRSALYVLLALSLAAIATDTLKTAVGFPRPSDVDARVIEPGDTPPVPLVARGAGGGFWDLPTGEARAAIRSLPNASYGFPSGHVSAAAAFCLALVAFFRWRGTAMLAVGWPLLMALSRMYLGRHFLADVLGGLAVGVLGAAGAILLVRWWDAAGEPSRRRHRVYLTAALTAVPAGLALWWPPLSPQYAGLLVGLMASMAFLERAGFPTDGGAWYRRAARVAGAVLVYVAANRGLDWVLETTTWEDHRLAALAAAALTVAATFVGGASLGRLLARGAVPRT